jgi:hypothetical protein
MTPCPSDLKLEAHLLDEAGSSIAPHLSSCDRCRTRVEEMRRLGDEFRREVYPATVDAVVARARSRSPLARWMVYLAPVPVAAAAAAVFLLIQPRGPGQGYLGIKGSRLTLAVFVRATEAVRAVADGESVSPSAALRFQVHPASPCRLWLVSVDAAGTVSRLYPVAGEGGAELAAPGPLPGGAMLDGKPGPERIYAVCTARPMAFPDLERAVRAAAGAGASAVRQGRPLQGLPGDAAQATLLLEKRP